MLKITDKSRCCGCEACANVCPKGCISMLPDSEGFLYPHVDETACVDCGLCEKVCPYTHPREGQVPLSVLAAKSRDEDIRLHSSSGGLFTELAQKVISHGGVVFGARFDEHWQVVHDHTDSLEGLSTFKGSKYVQSSIRNSFREAKAFLAGGREVLFVGTPCQIAGLRTYLGRDYEGLYVVDLVCHGVPSPGVWQAYLSELSKGEKISSVSFRDKANGWKNYGFSLKLETGRIIHELFRENLFMKAFLSDIILRPACSHCPFKGGRSLSDITLGDFWCIQNVLPGFDDDKGSSVILNWTHRGELLIDDIDIDSTNVDYGAAISGNPCIVSPVKGSTARPFFFSGLRRSGSFRKTIDRTLSRNPFLRIVRYIYRRLGL